MKQLLTLCIALSALLGFTQSSSRLPWQGNPDTPDWLERWPVPKGITFGADNIKVLKDSSRPEGFIRVRFTAGSWSPAATRAAGIPIGGTQFYAETLPQGVEDVTLSYWIRFPVGFNWVKGGKLPGLYGGIGNTGDNTPNGRDGFTTRYMWREDGRGIAYPFLPTSEGDGTTIQLGRPLFQADGQWHQLRQRVILNHPDRADGSITVWYDGRQVSQTSGLTFRSVAGLKVNGVLFQAFFGGSSRDWATSSETYLDFASFEVSFN